MKDPKRPIAELVKRWREQALYIREEEKRHARNGRQDLRAECERKADAIFDMANELQAAIDEQIRVWERGGQARTMSPPTPYDVLQQCISDLRGDNQGGQDDG